MTDHTHAPDRSDGEPGLPELAARWAAATMPKAMVSFSRAEGRAMLLGYLRELTDAVRAEPFSARPGTHVAERLVRNDLVHHEVVGTSVGLLGTELLPAADIANTPENRRRVVELCSALSTEFARALRDRVFDQQESIKVSAFNAYTESERQRLEINARLNAVLSSSAIGIGVGDLEGKVVQANPKLEAILGYEHDGLLGLAIYDLIDHSARQRLWRKYRMLCAGELDSFVDESQWINAQDEPIWVRVTISLVRNQDGTPAYPVAMVDNTSHTHHLEGRLAEQSVYDELTRLSKFPTFRNNVEEALATAGPGDRLALCFFDLDGFKVINDGVSREAGDRVLTRVTRVLGDVFGEFHATVSRITGDGFAVLIVRPPSPHDVTGLAQDVLNQITEPLWEPDGGPGIACSASVGVVESAASGVTAAELITAGEITTHRAKLSGKAQWVQYDAEQNRHHLERFRLGAEIPGALENGEFVTRYQPVLRLADRSVVGMRSFARWDHARLGRLAPPQFLDLAEQTGIAAGLGEWALTEVCRQAAAWRATFGDEAPVIGLAFSVRTASDPELVGRILSQLDEYDVPFWQLHLVFPLSTLSDPDGNATNSIMALSDNGVRLTATGFGGGDLTLADIRDLPLDGISLSSAVPRVIAEGGDAPSFVERGVADLAAFAHGLDLTVTAGDVDSVDVASRLDALGVDLAFGEALGPAGKPEEIEHVLVPETPAHVN